MVSVARFHISRRRVRNWLVAASILVVLAALHRPLLRSVAAFLIDAPPAGRSDYLVLLPSVLETRAAADEVAQRFFSGDVHGVLFFEPPETRAVRCGAWPDPATSLRRQLLNRGLPSSAIIVLPQQCRTTSEAADALRPWLADRPAVRLMILGREFRGRADRRIFGSALDVRQSANLEFAAVHGGVDANNWWQSREGIQLVFQNYAALAFEWWNGQSTACRPAWTLAEFEQSLPQVAH